ncbi:hypothetical protein ACFSCX_16180 [Bacillus salitolerans]|uniref:DUF3899 domain-containing protein n=1 Tax=Bacillus salitolerans TaxID=1437434 RepID=A0ABW4LSF4_9BACI
MKRTRFLIFTLIVIFIEVGISYVITKIFPLRMIDAMFFVGVACSAFFGYFSSSGGMMANARDAEYATSWLGIKSKYKMNYKSFSIGVNFLVLGSIIFLLLGFIIAVWL